MKEYVFVYVISVYLFWNIITLSLTIIIEFRKNSPHIDKFIIHSLNHIFMEKLLGEELV